MDKKNMVMKSFFVKTLVIEDEDLQKINKYTLEPLTSEDVFAFKAMIADNENDDRNYMPFNLKALQDMAKLYVGKTMLLDHEWSANKQIARIYDTELLQSKKTTAFGEPHTELIVKIYMPVTESNKDIITEIKAGIKNEVSTYCLPEKVMCNICGVDNAKGYCRHWPGREYEYTDGNGKAKRKKCIMLLDGVKEAYELSFVAVPAQPRAGTRKEIMEQAKEKAKKSEEVSARLRLAETKIKNEKEI